MVLAGAGEGLSAEGVVGKVFLTGGSGYIGRATIAELVRQGHVAKALARSGKAEQTVAVIGATALRGGLADPDVLNHAAARAEAVTSDVPPTASTSPNPCVPSDSCAGRTPREEPFPQPGDLAKL
jgi:short subunit dehydrogenase-like uncharacterized protein